MADPLQLGFSDYEQIYAKKRTRRQRFLDERWRSRFPGKRFWP
jgi:hypothetical protein